MDNRSELYNSSPLYFDRDLSWIDFNERVLEEGLRKDLPLFERLRFLAIVSSNFDEFFMVRVAAIKRTLPALHSGDPAGGEHAELQPRPVFARSVDSSRLDPAQQLQIIYEKTLSIINRMSSCLMDEIFTGLAASGLELVRPNSYTVPQTEFLESFFIHQIFPVLTPLRIENDKPLPFFASRCINAAFLLAAEDSLFTEVTADENTAGKIVMVQLPASLSRIVWLPAEGDGLRWALLDDIILTWGSYLFPGHQILESMLFKINRDADFSVDEQRDEDFVEAMGEVLEEREKSEAVRMVYSPGSKKLRDELAKRFSLSASDVYEQKALINPDSLMELTSVTGFEGLQERAWKIHPAPGFTDDVPVWDRLSQGDLILHFPYQSFDPVVRFFQEAASDPQVIAIKTTLYRTSSGTGSPNSVSPILRALEKAALNGKHVTALVELKARFNEERNITWANRLEKAGVIVVYGLSQLKVHAKVSMVLRREDDRIKRYVHLSTGNYNDNTARSYEDLCLFTCREELAYDTNLLFNMITGYSQIQTMRHMAIAPYNLKSRLLELIKNEENRAAQNSPGRIMMKCNSITDTDVINALYHASQAGAKILLCVRGICALVPGVPGLSENIRVISVIDYYLEHSRIYYFFNGGAEELYLSSADLMPRNLERRVELLFPIPDKKIHSELLEIFNLYFQDNCQARVLGPEGTWKRLQPLPGETPFRVQKDLLSRAADESSGPQPIKKEFIVRRSPPVEQQG